MRPPLLLLATLVATFTASAQVPSYVPTDGLVGWFAMDGDITNEVNGASGSAIGTTTEPDRNGQAGASLGFNGAAYGVLQNAGMPTGEFTISTWVKQSQSWSTGAGIEFICVGSSANTSWGTVAGPEFIHLNRGRGCSGNGQVLSGVNFPLNEWVHLTYVCAGPGAATEVYLNGAYVGQSLNTTSGSCGSSNLYFGVDIFSAPEYITGGLDDIGIWNRQLSAEEVQQVFASEDSTTLPEYVPTDGLIAFYPMDGDAKDAGPYGLDGTLLGPVAAEGRNGETNGALSFNGNRMEVAHSVEFDSPTLTVSHWINSASSQRQVAIKQNVFQGAGLERFALTHRISGSNLIEWAVKESCEGAGAEWKRNQSSSSATDGNWHHVVGVIDDSETRVYLDGQLLQTLPIDPNAVHCYGGDIIIGQEWSGVNYDVDGRIDEVGFWNRALTDEELEALISGAVIQGCTNPTACNFDADANVDDGSCLLLDCETLCGEGTLWDSELEQCVANAPDTIVVTDTLLVPTPFCGAGTHWDPVTEMCIADVPGTTDENCTLMNLQELAAGYQVLLDHTADQDSIILAQQAVIDSMNALPPCSCSEPVLYQGYSYDVVQVGDQCWFAENLRSENFRNGEAIENLSVNLDWYNALDSELSAVCENLNPFCESNTCGMLYNRFAVEDERGICPTGWTVPTDSDWMQLEATLGLPAEQLSNLGWRGSDQGTMLKSNFLWNGTNAVGFNAKPEGYRSDLGLYSNTEDAHYWCQNAGNDESWYRSVNTSEGRIYRPTNANPAAAGGGSLPRYGFSVRCVKD